MKETYKHKLLWCGINLLRLLLAATFIFSGAVKLIDPHGTEYKIADYAQAFGLSGWMVGLVPLTLAILLAATEFVLGVQMLFGIKHRRTSWLVLLFMLAMTPLTAYLYLTDVVVDCGCFGEAVVLSNGQTFLKNIVLLTAAVLTTRYHHLLSSPNTRRTRWIVSLYSWVFAFALAAVNLYGLPMIDFRPFKVGTDLQAKLADYEDMSMIQDFGMWNPMTQEEEAETFLSAPGYKFLLTMPSVETADDGVMDRLMALSDYCRDNGYPIFGLTASSIEAINHWRDITGAEYPFCQTDQLVLKTMVRSNPGLVLLRDGQIVGKWAKTQLPSDKALSVPLEQAEWAEQKMQTGIQRFLRLLWWYVVPMLLFTLLDRLWWLRRKNKKNKQDKLNQLKTKTMRKKIVAGNWKMNKTLQEGVALATELKEALAAEKPNCEVIIGTPFIHLATVSELLKDSVIGVSAENCANKESGAYTGEVSAAMVKSTGAEYVILGHSERREYYHETPEILKEKVDLALANGLKVIFCIGESLEEREANKQEEVCKAELAGSVFHLTAEQWKNIVIAYEPIWAIGTGKTATSDQAEEIHAYIRKCVAEVYGAEVADETSILYGGSCKASNAPELFAKPDIDGGLIGGASLKCADFKGIIDAWK